nr:Dihydrofolate reductase [uncultured bacterium]
MIILGPVAIAENGVIGSNNDLPWHLPEDLKHFKELTLGKTVLMGRKTFDSIFKRLGKPLPGRKNVVITRQTDLAMPAGVLVFHDLDKALEALREDEVCVIGGAQIFEQALPHAQIMQITHVHGNYEGDVYFPEIDWDQWEKTAEQKQDKFTFAEYRRKHLAS